MKLPLSARLDPWLLLGVAFAPRLQLPFSLALLAALALAWWRTAPPRREARWVLGAATLALAVILAGWLTDRGAVGRDEESLADRYRQRWEEIDQAAARAAAALVGVPGVVDARRLAFAELAREVESARHSHQLSLVLLDADGEAVAWAGEGLVHELAPERLPTSGPDFRVSFGAVSLLSVRPIGQASRPWRVVAGRSLRTDGVPFHGAEGAGRGGSWSLALAAEPLPPGCRRIAVAGLPSLVLRPGPTLESGRAGATARRVAGLVLGGALLAVVVLRALGLALLAGTVVPARQRPWEVAVVGLGGALAIAAAAGVRPLVLTLLGAGLAAGIGGASVARPTGRRLAAQLGAAGGLLLTLVAALEQRRIGPQDLAQSWLGSADEVALRLGFCGLAVGLLAALGAMARRVEADEMGARVLESERARGRARGRSGGLLRRLDPSLLDWLGILLVALAATAIDRPALAVGGVVLAGGVMGFWLAGARRSRAASWISIGLFAAWWSATAWQIAYRAELRRALPAAVAELAPPGLAGLRDEAVAIARHFGRLDLAAVLPRPLAGVDTRDLAFTLWRGSPLARREAYSALVLLPLVGSPTSSFDYGLPLTDRLELDREPTRWTELAPTVWRDLLIAGEVELTAAGKPWGRARYWLLPRPGFARPPRRLPMPSADLLAGRPASRNPAEELPGTPRWALYAPEAQAVSSPWRESPPPLALLPPSGAPPARVSTPDGPAWAVTRRSDAGLDALFLPALGAAEGLERAGVQALAVLLPAGVAVLLVLLLALPRAASRDWVLRTVRSYSRRLVLVFTVLLLVPLLSLYAVLASGVADWLIREQRAGGEAALNSAQRVLAEYLLELEPGFGLDTALDDDLLTWLSRVVQHDVNLYWGSEVYASSKHELFTAGLLPRRIPGEIYARLALYGDPLASRVSRLGRDRFLELYAPLRIPGVPAGRGRLFLSLPLFAEQRELAAELAHLRRRALAGTVALFLALVAVGQRLARNFTRPLTELVRGTQSIAAGAPSLEARPAELELAALSEAIDAMARHIAEGRERLLREKQVVERIVDSVTSGVVSLDYDGRVALANRAARELLGVAPGEPLAEKLAATPGLQPVAEFLAVGVDELRHATVKLAPAGGEAREWSLVWVPIAGAGDPASLLVVEDATEVLRGQRLAAWAEMARLIAHEIKNPLTPIRLSTEHLREAWHRDREHFADVFERCTDNILRQVEELRSIAGEFSTYSQIPRLERQPGDLARTVAEVVAGYLSSAVAGVAVEVAAEPASVPCRFDPRLLARAVRNLIENAVRASGHDGRVRVRVEADDLEARVVVADQGPGVPEELLPRIFEPYFSTHAGGTGLGLPIARRIAEEHGGGLTARNLAGGGLEVTITIPR